MTDDDDQRRIVVRLKVLGSFEIERDGEPLPLPSQAAAERLLVLLAIRERYTAREVVGCLWPDSNINDYKQAKSLRNLLDRAASDARAALGLNAASGVLKRERGSIRRAAKGSIIEFTSDLDDFYRLAGSPEADDQRAALRLVRGPVVQFLDTKNMKTDRIDEARKEQQAKVEHLVGELRPDDSSEQQAAYVEQILAGRPPQFVGQAPRSSLPVGATRPEPETHVPRRLRLRLLLAAGLVIVLAAVLLLVLPSGGPSIPPEGSVVDAETGAVIAHPKVLPSHFPAQIAGGNSFQVCDVSKMDPCQRGFSGRPPVKVTLGDRLLFRVTLNDGYSQAINYVKVEANAFPVVKAAGEASAELEAEATVRWPEALGEHEVIDIAGKTIGGVSSGHQIGITPVYLKLPSTGHYELDYVAGSTRIANKGEHFSHPLPDGILRGGIALEHVGPPPSCFWCAQQYIRAVYFEAQVVKTQAG
jgi:hypothetical protein